MLRLFGAKLKHARRECRLTQGELAHRLALNSHTHISHLESGRKSPSLDLVVRLSQVVAVTTDYLLRDTIPVAAFPAHRLVGEADTWSGEDSFGHRLRHLRSHHGLLQADLAERLPPYTQAHISLLELGGSAPSIDLVLRLAELFDVTTDYLLRGGGALE